MDDERPRAQAAKRAGEFLRNQALADAHTLGPGAITQANSQRKRWGLRGGRYYPSHSSAPTANGLGSFALALGLDPIAWAERAARFARGPVAALMALSEQVKRRRRGKRLPGALSAARARTWLAPAELPAGMLEDLEAMRYDEPRPALRASRAALKKAAGPSAVGRLLAIHASNLRECDELADALLALWVALPTLDVSGDAWGMGRALTTAAAVVRALGEPDLAGGLIDEAEKMYVRSGSMTGRATVLAFRGVLARNAGHPRKALCELDAALALYPPKERLYTACAHQVRSLTLVDLGDLVAAREDTAAALTRVPDARALRGRIAWQAAGIESSAGEHATAEVLLRQAFGLVSEPLCDRLLIAAQAVRAAIQQGETRRAVATAKSLLGPLLAPLDKPDPTRRVLSAAHADLYRAALEAGLTSDVVEKAIYRIETARTARRKLLRRQVC